MEKEKIEKNQDLKKELQKIQNVNVKIIRLVVGFLGATPNIPNRLKETDTTSEMGKFRGQCYQHSFKGSRNLRLLVVV